MENNSGFRSALSVVSSNDGGVVITGDNDSLFVAKLDFSGNIEWLNFYGAGKGKDILITCDNKYLISGEGGFILKIENDGKLIWKKYFNAYSLENVIEGIDNGYIFSGTTFNNNSSVSILIKTDTSGNVLWSSSFLIHNSTGSISLLKLYNSYLIVGRTNAIIGNIRENFILKTDINGIEKYRKIYISNFSEYFNDIYFINNNKYAICLDRDSNSINPIYRLAKIMIIDSIGNIIESRIFNSVESQFLYSITSAENGDLLFTGSSRKKSFGGIDDIWIIRTDSLLNSPTVNITNISIQNPNIAILFPNFPNPFNPETKIKFEIPTKSKVKIIIFNILGKKLKTLLNMDLFSGVHEIILDGADLNSGTYVYSLFINDKFIKARKMQLIK
ncbi:MAG: T9SS type A sorting domain-containing protein [Ignavibacteria bacterium]